MCGDVRTAPFRMEMLRTDNAGIGNLPLYVRKRTDGQRPDQEQWDIRGWLRIVQLTDSVTRE